MIACCFNSFGCHIIGLPQDMHQALISYTDIAAIRNYKNTCKKLYDNVHFHMASDYSIASMATVTCLRGLIAFAQQQDQMRVKEKDSPCDNIQNNFMRFLSRSGIKEYFATELVLKKVTNKMGMFLNTQGLLAIDLETSQQKPLFQDNDARNIATKLLLYAKHYKPSNMHDNKSPFLIDIYKKDKASLLINMFNNNKNLPLLLAHPGFEVNLPDKNGNTALMLACTHNNIEAVKILLAEQNVNVNLQNEDGNTALTLACTQNNIEVVKILLAHQNVNINQQNKWGYTALMRACTCNLEIVKQLLADPNINVNQQNEDGNTAFMLACKYNHREIVTILLADPRVNVNLQSVITLDGMIITISKYHNHQFRYGVDGYTAFMLACTHNNIDVVKILLTDQKVNVNQKNSAGYTAFMLACTHNHREVVKVLLADQRVKVNPQNRDGNTAFMLACTHNNIDVVKILLADQRVNVNQDSDGNTAFMLACKHNHREVIKILLAAQKVNVNQQNSDGNTAFMLACTHNNIDVVKILLTNQKVNDNQQNKYGKTALILACTQKHRKVVKTLLAHQHTWPVGKIMYNLYLKYGVTAIALATIAVLVGKGIVVSSFFYGAFHTFL